MGVVARGTDLRSKGFSDGSRVYCCRALSKPGMDTVRPRGQWEREVTLFGMYDRMNTRNLSWKTEVLASRLYDPEKAT